MRRAVTALVVLLVVALLAGSGLLFRQGQEAPNGSDPAAPSEDRPAAGQEQPDPASPMPALASPPLAADTSPPEEPAPTVVGLRRALARTTADERLGQRLAGVVLDAGTGQVLWEQDAQRVSRPASTAKLLTGAAALTVLPPATRLRTKVLAGPRDGDVVLVGGGDATLSSSKSARPASSRLVLAGEQPSYPRAPRLADLAAATREALGGQRVRRVLVDSSLYTGPRTGPGWRATYLTEGASAPVTALSVDGGRVKPGEQVREDEPDLAAGRALARLLVDGDGQSEQAPQVTRGTATAGARELAVVESAVVSALVEQMLVNSDNELAEALARRVALETGGPASFAGAAAAVRQAAGTLGLDPQQTRSADGSGLSRDSRVAPQALGQLLLMAADPSRPHLRPLLAGLPVASLSGTLAQRYDDRAAGAGTVRAKTGTLAGVSALAGSVTDADGRLLLFVLNSNAVPLGGTRSAEQALDAVTGTLARCGCR